MQHKNLPPQSVHTERYVSIRNATLVGVFVNLLLVAIKLVFGWLGRSQALIADGLHSLSDLISDAVILIAAKYGAKGVNKEFPYGHARFETLATIIVGGLLLLVATATIADAVRRLWHPQLLFHPKGMSLAVAVIAILVKEALFHYTMFIAEKVRSQMLRAHAWHHRTDAISTVIVFVGIIGTMAGVPWLDAVAAILVGLMIAQIGWSLGWGGLSELLDKGLDDNQLEAIKNTIKSVDGVRTLHMLRTRRMSESAFVDVHITVNPRLSVSEGHHIAETVAATLIDQIEEVADVIVHIDAEEDDKYTPGLPLRTAVIERLQKRWQSIETARAIENITLHYLSGKIMVEIYLPLRIVKDARHAEELAQRFIELAVGEPHIHSVQVYYH